MTLERIIWLEQQINKLKLNSDLSRYDLRVHNDYFTELTDLKDRLMTRLQELQVKFMACNELTYTEKREYEQLAQESMDIKRRDRRQGCI